MPAPNQLQELNRTGDKKKFGSQAGRRPDLRVARGSVVRELNQELEHRVEQRTLELAEAKAAIETLLEQEPAGQGKICRRQKITSKVPQSG